VVGVFFLGPPPPPPPSPAPLMVLLPPSRLQVNVTADHRIIYGAQAAEFLQTLKAVVENPDQLLL